MHIHTSKKSIMCHVHEATAAHTGTVAIEKQQLSSAIIWCQKTVICTGEQHKVTPCLLPEAMLGMLKASHGSPDQVVIIGRSLYGGARLHGKTCPYKCYGSNKSMLDNGGSHPQGYHVPQRWQAGRPPGTAVFLQVTHVRAHDQHCPQLCCLLHCHRGAAAGGVQIRRS